MKYSAFFFISVDVMHHHSPTVTTTDVSWTSFAIVYSIPIILMLSVICIIKWRPFREFPNIRSFCSWYCTFSPKKVAEELGRPDRVQMIVPIDAQSLASLSSTCADSPLLLRAEELEFATTSIP